MLFLNFNCCSGTQMLIGSLVKTSEEKGTFIHLSLRKNTIFNLRIFIQWRKKNDPRLPNLPIKRAVVFL